MLEETLIKRQALFLLWRAEEGQLEVRGGLASSFEAREIAERIVHFSPLVPKQMQNDADTFVFNWL